MCASSTLGILSSNVVASGKMVPSRVGVAENRMTQKPAEANEHNAPYQAVFGDVSKIVGASRSSAIRSVNATMTAAYWLIGHRIVEFEQAGEDRAEYGAALMERLASDLTKRFGRGFSRQNLQNMRLFYLSFPLEKIRQTVSGEFDNASIATRLAELLAAFPLNYAREHWGNEGENPPVGLILCSEKDEALAQYALDGLPNKVMASEYRITLPNEELLTAELERTREAIEIPGFIALPSAMRATAKSRP